MKIIIFIIFIIFNLYNELRSEKENYYELEPIVITEKIQDEIKTSLTRNIILISDKDIEKYGVNSIDKILNNYVGIDIQSREKGVLSDISIRGSNFEDVLVMLDGIPLNNPQTGHFNLNIPVSITEIERIEIMPGNSSALFGSYGYSGTINIITKKRENKEIEGIISYGNYKTYYLNSLIAYPLNKIIISGNGEYIKSDGFSYGREYEIKNVNSSINYEITKDDKLRIFYGEIKKDFGAYDFYTPDRNLASKEIIENKILKFDYEKKIREKIMKIKLYLNQAEDDFILKRENPTYYHNHHKSKKYGGEILFGFKISDLLFYSILLASNNDSIKSNRLGIRERENIGLGNEIIINKKNSSINLSGRLDIYRNEKYFNFNCGYYNWIDNNIKIRLNIGNAYRIPSFTELYYQDPYNYGNSKLKAARNISYEIGSDIYYKKYQIRNTFFIREENNFIDWVGNTDTGPWYAENIKDDLLFYGIENEINVLLTKTKIILRNTYISIKDKKNYISKYGLNYTKNQIVLLIERSLLYGIKTLSSFTYKKRNKNDYLITNIDLRKNIERDTTIFINIENIFNKKYEEIKGIKESERRINSGINLKF
ncbi:MAG TPA: TonB-dependent receptor [bacterium]|nr:TonB-dependent receptor [bacterium]HOL47118.1 TonB-dependent receptor [bacterium]HPQ18872.1 TonB-dependent receptor [bacterium]